MASVPLPPAFAARRLPLVLAVVLLLVLGGAVLWAQVSGDRGIAPVASSTDIEVHGIAVNVTGDTAQQARENGWREAQKLAWAQIHGPPLPDGQIAGLVSAVIIEREQLGPRRYIATLGVVFDRARAGALIGGEGEHARSAPLLTLPVMISGGTGTLFEVRSPWQRAWAEFQAGASSIDYVRPNGGGADSLLLTYGQTGRRSRLWWADILDQFGAADVIVPIARLRWSYPGGPVEGEFTARYGPDNRYLGGFTLRAANPDQVDTMLAQAVRRFDALFTQALADGRLAPDKTLSVGNVQLAPEVAALIEASRRSEEQQAAERAAETVITTPGATPAASASASEAPQQVSGYTVQVTTPDAASIDSALGSVRAAPGVRAVATSSIAIGGTSVLRVTFAGSLADLAAALRGRGWTVTQGASALAISR
ncbi:MAG: heavy-metal-associated domain-containing protein [Croceibacterium sp.]